MPAALLNVAKGNVQRRACYEGILSSHHRRGPSFPRQVKGDAQTEVSSYAWRTWRVCFPRARTPAPEPPRLEPPPSRWVRSIC